MTHNKSGKNESFDVNGNNYGILWLAGGILLIALIAVSIHFLGAEHPNCVGVADNTACSASAQYWADYRSAWGQFGDFMGGMVNPFIGLLTIFLIARSLAQNEKAIGLARDELEATRSAVEQAVDAQKKMEVSLKAQLAEAKSQNNFSNYFKHVEEFKKHMENFKRDAVIDYRKMHQLIFSDCINGNYGIDIDFLELYRSTRDKVFKEFITLDDVEKQNIPAIVKRIDQIIQTFSVESFDCIRIVELREKIPRIMVNGQPYGIASENVNTHMMLNIRILCCFEDAIKFDLQAKKSELDDCIFEMMYNTLQKASDLGWGKTANFEISVWYPVTKAERC